MCTSACIRYCPPSDEHSLKIAFLMSETNKFIFRKGNLREDQNSTFLADFEN